MFYPENLKATRAETVGRLHRYTKILAAIMMVVSPFVYAYLSHSLGFWIALAGGIVADALNGRESYISIIWHIRRGGVMLERLLFAGDRRFVLEQLRTDAIWRGDPINPEITERLAEMDKAEHDFKTKVDEILEQFTKGLAEIKPKTEDPKAN